MSLSEEILLFFSAIVIASSAILTLFGKSGRPARIAFFIIAALSSWTIFRFAVAFPEPSRLNYALPYDFGFVLALLPASLLFFTIVYAREDYAQSLKRYKLGLTLTVLTGLFFAVYGLMYPLLILKGAFPETHQILITRLGPWFFLYILVVSAMNMINLESTYRASWGVYRRKLRASVFFLALFLVSVLLGSSLILLSGEIRMIMVDILAVEAAFASVAVAFYLHSYKAQESGVYVRKQAIYSSLAIIIIGFYLVLAGAIGKMVQVIGGDVRLFVSVLGAMIAFFALMALVLSRSIKERIKSTLEKTLQKGEFDFEEELAAFSEDIATILDPEELTEKILELLRDKLGIGKLYLFYADPNQAYLRLVYPRQLADEQELRITSNGIFAEWIFRHGEAMIMEDLAQRLSGEAKNVPELEMLSRLDVSVTLPLIAKQKLVGILFLGPRANKEPLGHQEIQFLSSIGHQYSLALFSARLSEELLAARQIESFHKFTAFIMHDLKNSVSMLSMLLQNYQSNMENPEFQKSALVTIQGAVKRMQNVMDKLRSGEEQDRFNISLCNLNDIVLSLESRLGLKGQNKIEYISDLNWVPDVRGDCDKLEEVLRNLILNSLEAMPDGGKLVIRSRQDNKRVLVEVEDNGAGMSSEFISKKLFKPFATTKNKGLGIGLYQSRDWVEKMHGRMMVTSSPGQGALFTLSFPAAEE